MAWCASRSTWSVDVLPGMNAGASTSAVPSPIEGLGTAGVLLGSWALSPARPTPIPPRHECRGFSALLVNDRCHLVSDHPVDAVWHLREVSPETTAPLTDLEQMVYGVTNQQVP